jgi:DNA-binding transcriptional LysR family regulator
MPTWHGLHVTEAQLRVLLAVVDAGGFSLAGEQLAMSQPGVSRAVASLEEELGVQLLARQRGAVSLTNVGVQVAMHARGVLAHIEAIRQEAGHVSGAYAGRLRIGTLPSLSARLISPVLCRLHTEHPALEISLFEGTDETVLYWIRNQSVDVGLVARHAGDVDIAHLQDVELVAVVPAGHPASELAAVPLSALEDAPFVVANSGFERLVDKAFAAEARAPRVCFEVSDVSSAVAIVAADIGVTIVPRTLLDDVPAGALALPIAPPLVVPLGFAVASRAEALPAARAFLAAAGAARRYEAFAGQPSTNRSSASSPDPAW